MRYYITCDYNERNIVKELGAKWDYEKKQWYFTNLFDAEKFRKWLPENFDFCIAKKHDPALSTLCKELEIDRSSVKDWLVDKGYIIDSYTVTDEGKAFGIYEEKTASGKAKLVYNEAAQQFIKDNKDAILKDSVVCEYVKPELSAIDFDKLGINTDDYIILDTETTGLQKDDEVVELAIIDFSGQELYHSLFMPQKEIHWAATKKNKLTKKKLIGSPLFSDEWTKIKLIIGKKKLIAHNADFDYQLIKQTLARYGMDEKDAVNVFAGHIDSLDLVKKYIKTSNYNLEDVCKILGIIDEQKHRATYDCLMVLKMLRALEQSEYELVTKKEAGTALSSNAEKKERLKLVEKYVASGLSIDQISANLFISKGTAEKYVFELLQKGKLEYDSFVNPEIEEEILNVISLIGDWDKTLRPIKELLDDSISYFDIKVILAKNKLI